MSVSEHLVFSHSRLSPPRYRLPRRFETSSEQNAGFLDAGDDERSRRWQPAKFEHRGSSEITGLGLSLFRRDQDRAPVDAVGLVRIVDNANCREKALKFLNHKFDLRRDEVRLHLVSIVLNKAPHDSSDDSAASKAIKNYVVGQITTRNHARV